MVSPVTTIRQAVDDADLGAVVTVRAALDRLGGGPTLDNLRHSLSRGAVYLIAETDGALAGCGLVNANVSGADLYADVSVLPDARGRGVGSALFDAVRSTAAEHGAVTLTGEVWDDDAASLAWVERRAFQEVERQLAVVLDLTDLQPVSPVLPDGIRIVSRADLGDEAPLEAMWRVAVEAGSDIPGLDGEDEQSFADWRAHEIDRPSRDPRFSFIAFAGDEVVGVAALDVFSDDGYHGLTGVARAWRGRGIAEALKRTQIAAAKEAGMSRLLTESQQSNAPMRRLNEKLGFQPAPGMIVVRGPLS